MALVGLMYSLHYTQSPLATSAALSARSQLPQPDSLDISLPAALLLIHSTSTEDRLQAISSPEIFPEHSTLAALATQLECMLKDEVGLFLYSTPGMREGGKGEEESAVVVPSIVISKAVELLAGVWGGEGGLAATLRPGLERWAASGQVQILCYHLSVL
jgi:hypothetical protein